MNPTIKVVVVTGAGSMIGREIVRAFSEKGWAVHGTVRSKRKSKDLFTGNNIIYHEMDLENLKSVAKVIGKIGKLVPKIDVLVNNAGFVLTGPFESYTSKQAKRQMDVNFFGCINTIREILPWMKKHNEGTIVNISSLCGLVTFPLFSMYHASKWAIEGFSESARFELEPLGIRLKLVEPGGVKDDTYSSKVEFGEYKKAEYDELVGNVHRDTSWFPGFSTPAHVAGIVYEAATSETSRFRFIIGSESRMFIEERFNGFSDESFIAKMTDRLTNKK